MPNTRVQTDLYSDGQGLPVVCLLQNPPHALDGQEEIGQLIGVEICQSGRYALRNNQHVYLRLQHSSASGRLKGLTPR